MHMPILGRLKDQMAILYLQAHANFGHHYRSLSRSHGMRALGELPLGLGLYPLYTLKGRTGARSGKYPQNFGVESILSKSLFSNPPPAQVGGGGLRGLNPPRPPWEPFSHLPNGYLVSLLHCELNHGDLDGTFDGMSGCRSMQDAALRACMVKWGTRSATWCRMGQQQSRRMVSSKMTEEKWCTMRARCVPLPENTH